MQATSSKKLMKMGQVSKASGLPVSSIKFYMSQGLLPATKKAKPNVALYDDAFVRRLKVVKKMRSEGLSVKSIKGILDKQPFEKISEWQDFKRSAKRKDSRELETEERLATLSDKERRKETILDAAFEVFSKNGYNKATIDDVALKAGVSKGTCYQYFSGKEDLFIATIDRTAKKRIDDAEAAAEGVTDLMQRLALKEVVLTSSFIDLHFMYIDVYVEVLGGNDRFRKKVAETTNWLAEFLAKDIDLGIKQNIFRPIDSKVIAHAMIGIAAAAGYQGLINENFDSQSYMEGVYTLFRYGLYKKRV